ncbi:MAG TPA: serine hydrolase [Cyclobacteriaceae bacterium]|nr:serine hydrolase [Cyclobacteriaceae bacterium]
MRTLIILLCFVYSTSFAQKSNSLDKKVKEFEAYIINAQKVWEAPGIAVTVVKDGKVLLTKGYGVREINTNEPVDANTLFACASTTKAMVAAAMGILVDEGKVNWNDKVINHLPDFQLYDPYVTREITVRDLFTHNTGVGNTDFLWGLMDISGEEVLHKMRYVQPSYSLRAGYTYQNIFYLAAGKVIEKASGQSWDQFIRDRVFMPLGMTNTYPLLKDVKDSNQTRAHYKVNGEIMVIDHLSADQIGPAGSVWSSIADMSKWVTAMLDSSKFAGGRLLSANTWAEMFKPQILIPINQFYPTAQITKPNWTSYGLGWFQQDYKGRKINYHTGSLPGSIALNAQLPDENLGIYIFGNYDHVELRHALMFKAFDLFALGGNRDWNKEFFDLYEKIRLTSEKRTEDFKSKRVMDTKPSLALEAYAGNYRDKLYGNLLIKVEGDQLVFTSNNYLSGKLKHWHYDTFVTQFEKSWRGEWPVQFELNALGQVSKVSFSGFEFSRVE